MNDRSQKNRIDQKGEPIREDTGRKILIVDDIIKNLYMMDVLLKSAGYNTVTAKNGIEALEKLRSSQFDGIVSDILMPLMDGFRLIRECKKDPGLRKIPFIFYTATYTEKKDEEFGLSLGAIRYIIKPAEPEELLRKINEAFQEHMRSPRDYTMQPVLDEFAFSKEYTRRVGAKLDKKTHLLEESEEKYHLLYDNSMDAILLTSPDGRIMAANPAACAMFQRTEKEIIRNGRAGVVDTTDLRLPAALEERERTGQFKGELTFLRKDGTPFPGEVSSNFFTDSHGSTLTSIIIRDISEHKRAEDELHAAYEQVAASSEELRAQYDMLAESERIIRESEEKFKTLFESAGDAILIMDHDVFLDCNKKSEHIFGCTRAQIIGKSLVIFSPEHQPDGQLSAEIAQEKIDAAFSGENQFFEWIHVRSDGAPFTVELTFSRFMVGGTFYIQAIIRDISERKKHEHALQIANRKLALMTDVTYQDIQNKITGLRGYVELSKKNKNEPEQQSLFEKEKTILESIHDLIKKTKDYQQMGIDQSRWIPLDNTIRMQMSLISQKNNVSLDSNLNGLEICSDPLIERVFYNLILDAIQHGKTITRISFSCRETPYGMMLVCKDDGVGIPVEQKAHIFDRVVGGGGKFGLFFVREFLTLSDMTITETGTPGKGARFEIAIPKGLYRFTSQ